MQQSLARKLCSGSVEAPSSGTSRLRITLVFRAPAVGPPSSQRELFPLRLRAKGIGNAVNSRVPGALRTQLMAIGVTHL